MRGKVLDRYPRPRKRAEYRLRDHAGATTHVDHLDRDVARKRHRGDQALDDRFALAPATFVTGNPGPDIIGGFPVVVMVVRVVIVMVVLVVVVVIMVMAVTVVTMVVRIVRHR